MKRGQMCAVFAALGALTIHFPLFADVADGLIGYWPFDEGEGNVVHDVIGGHDGAIESATWTNDAKSGQWGLRFDPLDKAQVVVPDAPELDELPNGHSIANWIWPVSRGAMMDKSGNPQTRIQWFFFDDGRLHWGVGQSFSFTIMPIPFKEWSHVAWSHTPELSVVYVNGESVDPEEEGWGPIIPTGEPMIFGRSGVIAQGNPKQQTVEGVMDDFGFWNRGLSEDEIQEVYEKGLGTILAVSPKGRLAVTWAALKGTE